MRACARSDGVDDQHKHGLSVSAHVCHIWPVRETVRQGKRRCALAQADAARSPRPSVVLPLVAFARQRVPARHQAQTDLA